MINNEVGTWSSWMINNEVGTWSSCTYDMGLRLSLKHEGRFVNDADLFFCVSRKTFKLFQTMKETANVIGQKYLQVLQSCFACLFFAKFVVKYVLYIYH